MNRLGNTPKNNVMSFIGMIVFAVIFIAAFIFLSYLFLILALFAALIVLVAYVRARFLRKPMSSVTRVTIIESTSKGRVIDQDENPH